MYLGTGITNLLAFVVFGIYSFDNFNYRTTKVFNDNEYCVFTNPLAYFVVKTLIACTVECSGNGNCRRLMACNVDLNVQCHLYIEGENCQSNQPEKCTCMSKSYGRMADGEIICPLGLYGGQCENTIKDCTEGNARGLGVFNTWVRSYIKPLGSPSAFEVVCEFKYGGMTLFMARNWNCHDINFKRNITEYVDGFGDVYGDHWLGLTRIKEILNNHPRNKLSVMLMIGNGWCDNYYDDFSLGIESDWYPIHLGQYNLNAGARCGNSFTGSLNIEGSPFSAPGSDQTSFNCADQGGWWYVNDEECSEGSFMGLRDFMFWPSNKGIVPHNYVGLRIVPYYP